MGAYTGCRQAHKGGKIVNTNVELTIQAVMRYFRGNEKALEIALKKPYELYAEESADTIIEMIESEAS